MCLLLQQANLHFETLIAGIFTLLGVIIGFSLNLVYNYLRENRLKKRLMINIRKELDLNLKAVPNKIKAIEQDIESLEKNSLSRLQ